MPPISDNVRLFILLIAGTAAVLFAALSVYLEKSIRYFFRQMFGRTKGGPRPHTSVRVLFIYLAAILVSISGAAIADSAPSLSEITPTPSSTPEPSATTTLPVTLFPTETPIPTATETLTMTPSPSPTPDVRVIDIDPMKLLLQRDKLPSGGRYYLPNEGWISPNTNSEIVASWTVEEGQAYLAETGRIHGWIVIYKRGTSSVVMPEEVLDNVALYSNAAGAQLVVTKYGGRSLLENGFKEISAPQVGDVSRAFQKTLQARTWLRLNFTHRNVFHSIELIGSEQTVSLDFAVEVANQLINGLSQLPLSDTVQFTH